MAAAVLLNISIQKENVKKKKYSDKFHDVILYMEQIIYSFKKQPKIRLALSDAQKVSSNRMKEAIDPNTSTPSVDGTSNLFLLPAMNCFATLCCRV